MKPGGALSCTPPSPAPWHVSAPGTGRSPEMLLGVLWSEMSPPGLLSCPPAGHPAPRRLKWGCETGPGHGDLQTPSLIPVPWLRGGRDQPCVAGCPRRASPASPPALWSRGHSSGHVSRSHLSVCHSAALSTGRFVPAPSPAPQPWCAPTPAARLCRGTSPGPALGTAVQGTGLKCDGLSFINALSFGCLQHRLLLSCWSLSPRQALLPPSSRRPQH